MSYLELSSFLREQDVKLVAVSKTKPVEDIRAMYDLGQRDFGENRVQELMDKQEKLPENIRWHLIGHLQKNKVKYIAPFIHLIHSVDNLKLARKIDSEGEKNDRIIDVLLQIKIAREDSKFGYDFDRLKSEIESLKSLEYLRICGVMGMGTLTDNEDITRQEFDTLRNYFEILKKQDFENHKAFNEISMGMSGDYEIAIDKGSTMVRIGSLLFGPRN